MIAQAPSGAHCSQAWHIQGMEMLLLVLPAQQQEGWIWLCKWCTNGEKWKANINRLASQQQNKLSH